MIVIDIPKSRLLPLGAPESAAAEPVPQPAQQPPDFAAFAAELSIACRRLCAAGATPFNLMDALVANVAAIAGGIEPPAARQQILRNIATMLPNLVAQAVAARSRRPSGLIIPPGVKQ